MSAGAGSKVGLEVMPITSVTLSDGHGPGERAQSRPILRGRRRDADQDADHADLGDLSISARLPWPAAVDSCGDDRCRLYVVVIGVLDRGDELVGLPMASL